MVVSRKLGSNSRFESGRNEEIECWFRVAYFHVRLLLQQLDSKSNRLQTSGQPLIWSVKFSVAEYMSMTYKMEDLRYLVLTSRSCSLQPTKIGQDPKNWRHHRSSGTYCSVQPKNFPLLKPRSSMPILENLKAEATRKNK